MKTANSGRKDGTIVISDRQTDRQKDRQADRQKERQRDRKRKREKEIHRKEEIIDKKKKHTMIDWRPTRVCTCACMCLKV